jgi:hypothetical protein
MGPEVASILKRHKLKEANVIVYLPLRWILKFNKN